MSKIAVSWIASLTVEKIDTIVFILDSVTCITSLELNDPILKKLQITETVYLSMIKSAASSLSPSTENSVSTELLLPHSDPSSPVLRKVLIVALPTTASRHNTPSRSYSISNAVSSVSSSVNLVVAVMPSDLSHAFALCCTVGRQFPLFSMKTRGAPHENQVTIVLAHPTHDGSSAEDKALTARIAHTISGIRLTQRLVDAPPNVLHTEQYVEECRSVAKALKCKITVIQGTDLEKQGFGGIWGVGKASAYMPALVVLSHVPVGTEGQPSVCMVGKGIVYDTGGLSIKVPTTSMAGMKVDMGGSGAVLGAFQTLVQSNLVQGPVHALLCIAENSVSAVSTRPDDVLTMYSGKTVEVNNIDAEGRLVLADGCNYASKHCNPKVIVDIATLTGAQGIATGNNHGALYCNDDGLEAVAMQAGKFTGDLTHPMPYCPEFYKKEFASKVADMKNSVACRTNAQVSCAGQFIGNHIEDYLASGGKWLHIDMAFPARTGERATGFGVALLSEIAKNV